jgi:hypothetical protein
LIGGLVKEMTEFNKQPDQILFEYPITRVEVIDNKGRAYAKHNVERVWLSLQDDNQTLKVMVTYEDEEEIYID